MEDKDLIALIKTNAAAGLEEAMKQYSSSIKTICKAYLPDCSDDIIEETIADCFIALWQSIEHFNQGKNVSLKSYFYGISRKTALTQRRKLAKFAEHEELNEQLASTQEVETTVLNKLDCDILRDLILHMDSPDREVFISRFFEEKSMKEIATKLSMTVKAVENRITRGKKRLQKALIENGVNL